MSRIKSKNTKPELIVRKFLFAQGLRFRLHAKELPGKPDLVFPKYRTVVFVNGCFFHAHDCKYFKIPETRKEWWQEKITKNKLRDEKNIKKLNALGWKVIEFYECQLKEGKGPTSLTELLKLITK